MSVSSRVLSATVVVVTFVTGCPLAGVAPGVGDSSAVQNVAARAIDVAAHVGGSDGYGGSLMDGYADHMPSQMGFYGQTDLATGTGDMMVRLRNNSDQGCTFHLSYFASQTGLDDHMMDVEVAAGEEITVEIPCSEIVGIGPLDRPRETGCHLADGEAVDNVMAVPGFLGQDFTCDIGYECVLTPDVDDLDGDGDTEELIILSNAMEWHLMNGGPTGHRHGSGLGMMGSHMGM